MKYNWQYPNWANFTYDDSVINSLLIDLISETSEIKRMLNALSDDNQEDTILQFMISEAIKTSEIEREFFSRQDIMPSILLSNVILQIKGTNPFLFILVAEIKK